MGLLIARSSEERLPMGKSSFIAGDGCCWGAAARSVLLYIHSYISRDHDGVSPPFRGTPRCGIQVRTIFLATDTRRVHKTRGGSGHASAGTTTNLYIIIIFVIYHLYAYIGFIHIYIQTHPQYNHILDRINSPIMPLLIITTYLRYT